MLLVTNGCRSLSSQSIKAIHLINKFGLQCSVYSSA